MITYADLTKAERQAGTRSQRELLEQIKNNHLEYMKVLRMEEDDLQLYTELRPECSPFITVLTTESHVFELSVEPVPLLKVKVPRGLLECEPWIVARCKTSEQNIVGKGRLRNFSCLVYNMHEELLRELRTGQPIEQSIDDILRSRSIPLGLSRHGSSLLAEV